MNFCPHCGERVNSDQDVCLNCGAMLKNRSTSTTHTHVKDVGGFGWGFLGFMIPIAGIIIYALMKDTQPLNASAALKGALISIGISVLFYIIIAATGFGLYY